MNCLFCKIVGGEIPAKKVYEDAEVIAFRDIDPQSPVHILLVPRKHYAGLTDLAGNEEDEALLGHLLVVASQLARSEDLMQGYRIVINTGPDGGQTVDHLHLHLLGGRALGWPPG